MQTEGVVFGVDKLTIYLTKASRQKEEETAAAAAAAGLKVSAGRTFPELSKSIRMLAASLSRLEGRIVEQEGSSINGRMMGKDSGSEDALWEADPRAGVKLKGLDVERLACRLLVGEGSALSKSNLTSQSYKT